MMCSSAVIGCNNIATHFYIEEYTIDNVIISGSITLKTKYIRIYCDSCNISVLSYTNRMVGLDVKRTSITENQVEKYKALL